MTTSNVPTAIRIAEGLNGPRLSANGGVAAGTMAALLDGPVEVRLSSPPPMGTDLAVTEDDGWLVARDSDGDRVLAARAAAAPDVPLPPVDPSLVGDGEPFPDHPAITCVVCGVEHPQGLRLFPAPVPGHPDVLATWWTPPAWAIEDGVLRPDLLWGVLDCPGALAIMHVAGEPTFAALVGMTGELRAPVRAGERVLVLGFALEADGRKRTAGTAVLGEDGEVRGHTRQLTIAMPPAWARGEHQDD